MSNKKSILSGAGKNMAIQYNTIHLWSRQKWGGLELTNAAMSASLRIRIIDVNIRWPVSQAIICRYIDEGVVGNVIGPFLSTGRRLCHKTQKRPAKCMCTVLCMVFSFPPCVWNLKLCPVGQQYLSVVDSSSVWGILYGLAECLIFHSYSSQQGGGGGEGEWGTKLPISLHYRTWLRERGRERGGGLRSRPLITRRNYFTDGGGCLYCRRSAGHDAERAKEDAAYYSAARSCRGGAPAQHA